MDKYLVDSSVWIEYFKGNLTPSIYQHLVSGFRDNLVTITDVIRNEILVGALSESHFKELKSFLSAFQALRINEEQLEEFEWFAWNLAKMGFPGKYTDTSIAFLCHRHRLPLLSFDGYFRKLERKGILKTIRG